MWWFVFKDDYIKYVTGYFYSIQHIKVSADKVDLLVFGIQSDHFPAFYTTLITFSKSSHTIDKQEIYTLTEDGFLFPGGVDAKSASLEQGHFIMTGEDGQFYLGMMEIKNPSFPELISYQMFQFHDPTPAQFLEVTIETPDYIFPVDVLYMTENSFYKLTLAFDQYTVDAELDVQGIREIKRLNSGQYFLVFDQHYLIVDQNLNVVDNGDYDFSGNPILYLANNNLNILKYYYPGNGLIEVIIETLDISIPSNTIIQSYTLQTHLHLLQNFSIQSDYLHLYGSIGLQTTEQKYNLAEPFVFEASGSELNIFHVEFLGAEPVHWDPGIMKVILQIEIENKGLNDIENIKSFYLIPNTIFGNFYDERTFNLNVLAGEKVSFYFILYERFDKKIVGDSIQYTLPCIYFYPWQTIPDTNLVNNRICNFTFSLLSSNITDQFVLPTNAYYPNPFTDLLTVELEHSNSTSVLIYNVSGQLVHSSTQMPQGNQMQLRLDFLSPGIYHMHLVDNKNKKDYKPLRIIKKE